MKKRLHQIALMAGIAAMLAGSTSWAWGPRADVALVTMAGRFIAKGGAVPLTKLEKDIQYGASVTRAEMARLIPGAESSPVQAIESEMYLLRAVRGTRVDPYYAFRLGVLGKLVARLSSPLADAPVTYRNMYYADVDSNIDVQLVPSRRRVVDPDTFLKQLLTDTKSRESLILQDYQSGVGFGGVASRTLTDDASRSANAIADVWYTLFQGSVIVANVPETRVRDYYIEAIGFYIQRDNESESRNAYDQLMELDVRTPDMLKRIGDMYYDAGEYALAMKEYEAVLSIEPARRDVVERIADYYVQVSDEARKEGQLEDSRAALVRAIDVFQLHPTAQGKLFEVEKLIEERDARLEAARAALLEAHQFEGRAKQQVTLQNFGGAVELLRQAENAFLRVGTEFRQESLEARSGLNRITDQMTRLRDSLVVSVASLSGGGSMTSSCALASETAREMGREALQAITRNQYRSELGTLESELNERLAPSRP